jgi:hypothetical protein
MRRLHALAATALLFCAPSAHAGLLGVQFDAAYYYKDPSPPYSGATFTPSSFTVVDPGVESILNIENATYMSIDFTDDRLTILYTARDPNIPPTWGNYPINGPVFTLAPSSPTSSLGIAGFTVDPSTTLAGFNASNVTFNDTQIIINWGGLTYAVDDKVVIDFAFVPEPSSVIAMASGCIGLPLLALRRRRRAA